MVLSKQVQEIPLNGGLDVKQSAELQDPGTLTDVTNLRFNALHQLEKRAWYTDAVALKVGTAYDADGRIETIFPHRGYACGLTENEGVGYVSRTEVGATATPSLSFADSGGVAGRSRACRVSRQVIGATQFGTGSLGLLATTCAVIPSPEVTVVAWLELTTSATMTMRVVALDDKGSRIAETASTGLAYTFSFSNSPSIQSCVTGNSTPEALVTYVVDAGGGLFSLYGVRYNATTRSFTSPALIAANLGATSHHLLGGASSSSASYAAFTENTGPNLRVLTLNTTLGTTATHVGTHGSSVGVSLSRSASSGAVMVSSCTAANAYIERLGTPASVTTIYTATASETLVGVAAGNQKILTDTERHLVMVGIRDTQASLVFSVLTRNYDCSYTSLTAIASSMEPNVLPLTHGVTLGDRCYFGLHLGIGALENQLTSAVIVRADSAKLARVARVCHDRLVATPVYTSQVIHSFGAVGTSRITGAFLGDVSPIKPAAVVNLFGLGQSVMLPTITFAESGEAMPLVSVEHDGTTLLASGDLGDFDGKALNEAQPLHRPRARSVSVAAGPLTGLIRFSAVWRFVDQAGKLHRSSPSPVEFEALVGESLDVYVTRPPLSSLSGTGSMQFCDVELYVSEVAGTLLYLATTATGEKHVADLTTYPHLAYFQSVQPGLTTSPLIYTQGAAGQPLRSEPPPSFISLAKVSDVMWGVDAEDRRRMWHSKPMVAGFAVEWNSTNTLFLADEAVGVTDTNGTPTFLTKGGAWVVEGAGPNANGVGGFAPARRLPLEVSAICPTSLCKTPMGTFFRSARGISLLDNSFGLQPVGLPIDPLMPIRDERTASIRTMFDEKHNEVRVIDRDNGAYVYNLLEGKWTEFDQSVAFQYMADACVVGGRVWYAAMTQTDWELRRELGVDEADYNLSQTSWQLETPWMKVDGVAGFGRLWRAYTSLEQSPDELTTASLIVVLTLDWDDSTAVTYQVADVSALSGADEVFTVAVHPRRQSIKCFKLALAETCDADHAGSKPVSMRLEMGVRPGSKQRVPDAARKG